MTVNKSFRIWSAFSFWILASLNLCTSSGSLFCQTKPSVESFRREPDEEILSRHGVPFLSLRGHQNHILSTDKKKLINPNGSFETNATGAKESDEVVFESVPGLYGGTVRSIATDDSGRLFIATDGGVYRSTDNGLHWDTHLFPTQLYSDVEPVTILGPNIVAAETDFNDFMSTDAGESWNYSYVHGFALDTNGEIFAASDYGGIVKSTDTAKSWVQFGLAGKKIYNVVLCGEGRFVCSSDSGLFFSSDNGTTWTLKNFGPNFGPYIVGDKTGHLFSTRNNQISVSSDFGDSWNLITLQDSLPFDDVYRIDFTNDNKMFALTGTSIFVSSDAGTTWKVIPFPIGMPLSVGEDSQGNLLIGSFYGIFRLNQTGGTWESCNNGIHASRIERIQFTSQGSILAFSLGLLFRSTDEGESWTQIRLDSTIFLNAYAPMVSSSSGVIFMPAFFDGECGLIKSADDGLSWQKISVLSNYYAIYGITERVPGEIIAASSYGDIYRSTDNGTSWGKVVSSSKESELVCIASDRRGNSYAVGDTSIFISHDGVSWIKSSQRLEYSSIRPISIDNRGGVFISSFAGDGVYYSSDHGASWDSLGDNLGGIAVLSSAADDSGNVLLGTAAGIFRLADSVESWIWDSPGLPITFTTALSVSPDGFVYAGTQDYGMYKSLSPLKSRVPPGFPPTGPSIQFNLLQNYPNPFNPSTTIYYSISKSGSVTLKLYDILGREVRTLVNESEVAGDHHVSFTAVGLASGIYFYRLLAGGMTQTKKLMILK